MLRLPPCVCIVLLFVVAFVAAAPKSEDKSKPLPTHYFTVRPPKGHHGDEHATPSPAGSPSSSETGHYGMSTAGVVTLFACVAATYYTVLRMSQRAVAGDAYLLPHAEAVERLMACRGGVTGAPGPMGVRRYSTLSFDDTDGDAMHPTNGFDRAERAAMTTDPRSRI